MIHWILQYWVKLSCYSGKAIILSAFILIFRSCWQRDVETPIVPSSKNVSSPWMVMTVFYHVCFDNWEIVTIRGSQFFVDCQFLTYSLRRNFGHFFYYSLLRWAWKLIKIKHEIHEKLPTISLIPQKIIIINATYIANCYLRYLNQ